MTGRPKAHLGLTEVQRQELERMVRAGTAKFWDVIGVYLNRPGNAVVLCCDEKSVSGVAA
jgi:hypothetical protein